MSHDSRETPAELSADEVIVLLGISRTTLQRWETQYELIIPQRAGGGPVYTPMVVELLQVIRRLRRQGKTVGQIRQSIEGYKVRLVEEGLVNPVELPPFPAEKNLMALARRIEELSRQVGGLEAQNTYLRLQTEHLQQQLQLKDAKVNEMVARLQEWRGLQRRRPGKPPEPELGWWQRLRALFLRG